MSVLGIDFGTSACVLASIQKHNVTIIRNDLSERLTPTLISFSDQERYIGEAAQSKIKTNFKNTCRNIKQLMGLFQDNTAELEHEAKYALAPISFSDGNEGTLAGYTVKYNGEQKVYTAHRCLASLLSFLRSMAEKYLGTRVDDLVISVPVWYTHRARQAILDAAKIAGLTCLKLMNEQTAVALDYGIFRSSTYDAEKVASVVFVSVGHGSSFVSITGFSRGNLKVLACEADRYFGGRDIDYLIMQHFASKFQKKHDINLMEIPKAKLKLEEAASRMKKILSANTEASINIDCIVEDYELNGTLSRQEFEELCEPFKKKLSDLLKNAFEYAKIDPSTIGSVELVGGGCRILWIQSVISEFFQNKIPLSRTLSMDETIARGCALQAAILHPRYQVREFQMQDRIFQPILIQYQSSSSEDEFKNTKLFETGALLGSKRWLTFNRSTDIEFQLYYASSKPINYYVKLPSTFPENTTNPRVRVGVHLTESGVLRIDSAQLLVDEECVEPIEENTKSELPPQQQEGHANSEMKDTEKSIPSENSEQQAPNEEDDTAKEESSEIKKKKVKTQKIDCQFYQRNNQGLIDEKYRQTLIESERTMQLNDIKQQKYREAMNNLEAYIYDMRHNLSNTSSGLGSFATEEELSNCKAKLNQAEQWIMEEITDNTTQQDLEQRLQFLKDTCASIVQRNVEYEDQQAALQTLHKTILQIQDALKNQDWSHVPQDKLNSLTVKLDEQDRWLEQVTEQSRNTSLTEKRPVKASAINQETDLLLNFSKTILVPKPEAPAPQPESTPTQSTDQEPQKPVTPTDAPESTLEQSA